jgi:hypothetical protein
MADDLHKGAAPALCGKNAAILTETILYQQQSVRALVFVLGAQMIKPADFGPSRRCIVGRYGFEIEYVVSDRIQELIALIVRNLFMGGGM